VDRYLPINNVQVAMAESVHHGNILDEAVWVAHLIINHQANISIPQDALKSIS
jgi:hypothetical protein